MAIINTDNFGIATGRLPKDPKIFENKDGSKSVRFTLMIRNNFKSKDGSYESQGIDFQAFVPAGTDGDGVYGILKTGMLVQVTYEPRSNNYTDKDGVAHYEQVLRVNDVRIRESKAVSDARAAGKADDGAVEVADLEVDAVTIDELL